MARVRTTRTEYEVLGAYGQGWEVVTTEDTRAEARARLKEYNDNEPGIAHIIRTRRVKTDGTRVMIDGVPDVLRLVYVSKAPAYQYNTEGNRSAHTFSQRLEDMPAKFSSGGHQYEIIEEGTKTT